MIPLSTILRIERPTEHKLHLACWNGIDQPLDVFVRDRDEWDGWNRWRASRDDFSRQYILSLIDFYHEPGRWLFGGMYRVLSRSRANNAPSYEIEIVNEYEPMIGRLKVRLKRPGRAKAFNLENYYDQIEVAEILPRPYSGESFVGYDNIDVSFTALEGIVRAQRSDWKAALQNAKGVYMITDTSNGRRYVGSAYGLEGIWSRWESYIGTGHGNTDELSRLIAVTGIGYARTNFRFALLEHRTMRTSDEIIIDREVFWKRILLTRGPDGYNRN
jgi:hypothetical protein